ncbi:MAG: hypothetical protein LBP64_09495 [Tannerella sp.]|jgi:hypothetical protein|nr:hypothetical protein [Tannerella sp.]
MESIKRISDMLPHSAESRNFHNRRSATAGTEVAPPRLPERQDTLRSGEMPARPVYHCGFHPNIIYVRWNLTDSTNEMESRPNGNGIAVMKIQPFRLIRQ